MLDRALKDKSWTAALEQAGNYRKLPPAAVVDIDETVLDNAPYQASQVVAGVGFIPAQWTEWVMQAAAAPIPGAVEFCKYAASRGVQVFYVTNRDTGHEESTRRNLAAHGFPLATAVDTVLVRGEKAEWASSDKGIRRKEVASRYRILLLVGDDLGDFLSGVRASLARRRELSAPYTSFWGSKWIIIPNPGYGSWEEALLVGEKPETDSDRVRIRTALLDTARK